MLHHHGRHPRRSFCRHHLVFVIAVVIMMLAPAMDAFAQSAPPLQARPTPTPTEEFDPGLQAEPTVTPTPEPPRREQPAEEATEELQPAAPSSLTLNKGACDDATFDPYAATGLQAFLDACHSPDGEFEFTIHNDVAFNLTAETELGTLFTQLPTGPVTITETIPEGWGDPAVFCWSNLFPAPSDTPFIGNSPQWDVQEGEDVECWWFNVSQPEATGHAIRVEKRVCPDGFVIPDDYWTLANGCQEHLEGIGFAMTVEGGTDEASTDASGMIEWAGVDLGASGQVQLDEAIPEGYSEPVVWCVNFPVEAADAQDFEFFQVESTDGLVTAFPEQDEPFIFQCTYFNVNTGVAPGDLADPGSVEDGEGVEVTVIKHRCPLGAPEDTTYDQYIVICADNFPDLQFTLEHQGGAFPAETNENGEVEWTNVPAGEVTIQEALTAQYLDPLAFCGFFDGEQELQFGQEPAPGGLLSLTIPDEATNVTCWLFNIRNPDAENTIMVQKSICPPGTTTESNDKDFYLSTCESTDHAGVNFTLTAPHGEFTDATDANGVIEWATVPLGDFSIQEEIPDGYGEPVVFCNFGDVIQGIGFQNGPPTRVPAPGGLVSAAIEEPNVDYLCYYFNIPQAENSLTVNKWRCPPGFDQNVGNVDADCVWPMDGVTFTLGDLETTTGDFLAGRAVFQDVPPGEVELAEVIPEGMASTFFGGCALNGVPTAVLFGAVNPPTVIFDLDEGDHWVCDWYNVPVVESRVVVNKRICPADADLVLTEDNTIDDIINACPTEGDGIEFTLDHVGGSSTQAIEGGDTVWDGVPNGPITITETIPPGYLEPVWYCNPNAFDEHGDLVVDVQSEPFDAPAGVLAESLDEPYGEIFGCWVFNVLDPDATTVTVIKWLCPAGFDVETDDPVLECAEPMDNVNFMLDDLVATTGDAGPGVALFEDVPAGDDYELTEFLPGDIAYAFVTHCSQADGPDLIPLSDEMPPVVSLDIAAGDHWTCHWYNVPDDSTSITIEKYLCPVGYDLDAPMTDPVTDCTETHDGVTFTLADGNLPDPDQSRQTGDDGPGTVVFSDLTPGTWTVTEEVPAGIVAAAAWCPTITGNPQVFNDPPRAVFEVEEGEQYSCLWFNVPEEDGDNDILIHKWLCPEGFNPNSSEEEYFDTCTEALDGITFKAMSDLGIAVLDTVDGQVGFGGFPSGMNVGIQEEIPDGYSNPYVICEYDDGQWHDVGAQAGYFEMYFPGSGQTVECHVFNLHGETPDLTILKWTCPAGYDLFAEGADPQVDCTEATNGVAFELRYEGNPALVEAQTTGEVIDGGVVFDDLEPNVYNVAELVPDGIASAFILECGGHLMGMLQPYPLQFGNVLDDIDLDAGEHLTCHWYNVPEDEGGDLTLIKYTCTTEVFVSEVDCQVEEDGKTFDLLHWNAGSGEWDVLDTAVTDGAGRIIWTGLDDGEYWFEEHDGAWCHLVSDQLADDGASLNLVDDQETVVHVYNCDGTPGEPGDTPTKYPNTGVPTDSATPDASGQGTATRVGFLDAFAREDGFLGPFSGLIGIAFLAWRVVWIGRRVAQQREEREEQAWYEAQAATSGYLTTRAERLGQTDDPLSRPHWMRKEPSSPTPPVPN